MHSNVKSQVPDFIWEYVIYCDCFTDIYKQKTCWVLTRNLKFFEYCQKQLVGSIDLQTTCLNKLKADLENYKGCKSKWYETSPGSPSTVEIKPSDICLGKYVFHALNLYKVYVIIKCWNKCVILKRLSDFKGFEIKAEYENIQSYRIVHGTIKFCPVLELQFLDKDVLKTDFEDTVVNVDEDDTPDKNMEVRQLLERIRCAKAELELHKSITAKQFYNVQRNFTFGQPFLRTYKQEEKQILGRCGDIWKRFTAHDDLVVGVPLVNQCALPNSSIVRNLKPILQTNESLENSIEVHYRLFQLKLKFDQLDDVEAFLESEDEDLQGKVWCANGDFQLLPESFAVLLIKLKISQIIGLKESPLILNYEVIRHLHTMPDTKNATFTMPLQIFLQNLDFHKLLFEERQKIELKFLPHTLQQDFLTIAMTSLTTNLEITFKTFKDLEIFENFLQKRLDFLKPKLSSYSHLDNYNFSSVFYNSKTSSLWFGSLILRLKKITENDENHCQTTWKIYCKNYDKILLLIKTFVNDHLSVDCNIISITNCNKKNATECVGKFQNALRQELLQLQAIARDNNDKNQTERLKSKEKLYNLQMNTDNIASDILENE